MWFLCAGRCQGARPGELHILGGACPCEPQGLLGYCQGELHNLGRACPCEPWELGGACEQASFAFGTELFSVILLGALLE